MIITPGAYAVHDTAGQFWTGGETATLALERIAEIGDPSEAVASLGATAIDAAPANGDSVSFEITATPGQLFSSAQMLIATNDGFVGVNSEALFEGDTPRTITLDLMAYDAGTEENSDLFSGFAAGQPDPAEGMANVDNGTATTESIVPATQFSGTQARVTIEALVASGGAGTPAPAAAGNGGFASTTGSSALIVLALGLLATGLVVGGRKVTNR